MACPNVAAIEATINVVNLMSATEHKRTQTPYPVTPALVKIFLRTVSFDSSDQNVALRQYGTLFLWVAEGTWAMFPSSSIPVKDRIKIVFAAASLVLAGCSTDAVRLQSKINRSAYDYLNFSKYHAGRDTRVVVHGNPFAMKSAAFEKAVTDNMQGAHFGRRTNFTTTPGGSAHANKWVVMAFNADIGISQICKSGPTKTRPGTNELKLSAAWCFDGRRDSLVEAVVGQAEDSNDPRFRALIRQTVLQLFPQNDRVLGEGKGGRRRRKR